ncbi:hypothetical protein CROQUDRAFT_131658 [Cronartium quercuum f. sp. fusiforme G11]|uniref:SWI5-dependent HO expression protein 3 n=1 Tax=Cronartium quercuum f. sp. fusiforme G11 TaxID=708437 RepID=A0A9P6NNU2_9BASI|nr:hypothetical protein CROQUDRAFT_131658 [Cronartium quercuum f. sp. fusiforme G11]
MAAATPSRSPSRSRSRCSSSNQVSPHRSSNQSDPNSTSTPIKPKPSPITRIPFPLNRQGSRPHPSPSADSTPVKQPAIIHSTNEVNMLKEQLAKLQAELRIARGQPSTPDRPPSSTSTSSKLKRSVTLDRTSSTLHHSSSSSSITTSPGQQKSQGKSSRLARKRSSVTSETSEGLSIRLISGPGLVQASSATLLTTPSEFPTTESGYVRDAQGNWVPLKRVNSVTEHDLQPGHLTSPNGTTRSLGSDDGRGLSRIPISAVSMGRLLVGDTTGRVGENEEDEAEPLPHSPSLPDQQHHMPAPVRRRYPRQPPSLTTLAEAGAGGEIGPTCLSPGRESRSSVSGEGSDARPSTRQSSSRGNPFFGSGGGRDRGAMIHQANSAEKALNGGNTGRVITNLQSDLLYARTALDQSKSQLRLSQRAVESLTRQTEDLKESMSRLRLENEGLSKMLARKERTVSELMDRIKKSESELTTTKAEKKEMESTVKKLTKETDEVVKDSLRRRDRAETQYEAVRSGVKSLSDGWKRDVIGLKSDMHKLEEKHRKELEDSRMKYNTLAKLHASRSGALSALESTLNSLQSTKETIINTYSIELRTLQTNLKADQVASETGLAMAKEVANECARFKRILREHEP